MTATHSPMPTLHRRQDGQHTVAGRELFAALGLSTTGRGGDGGSNGAYSAWARRNLDDLGPGAVEAFRERRSWRGPQRTNHHIATDAAQEIARQYLGRRPATAQRVLVYLQTAIAQNPEGYTPDGAVYFAQSRETGLIKIGFSTSVGHRARILPRQFPTEFCTVPTILATVPGSYRTESGLHRRFSAQHEPRPGCREMFRLEDDLRDYLDSLGALDDVDTAAAA